MHYRAEPVELRSERRDQWLLEVSQVPEFYEDLSSVAPAMRDRTIFMTGGFLESSTEDFIEGTGRPSIKKPFDLVEMARTVEG